MWQLLINGPGYADTTFELHPGITAVGRADENDVVLSGDLVSRRHVRLHLQGGSLLLEDLGSRNGVRLNGEKTAGTRPLQAGDILGVGENTLVIQRLPDPPGSAPEGGPVRRFGHGQALREAVVMSRSLRDEPSVLQALDNVTPFELRQAPPVGRGPHDTETSEAGPRDTLDRTPVMVRSLALLYRVAERLARATELQAFLDETTDLVMQRVGAGTGVVLLTHPTGVMVPAAVRHQGALARDEVPVSDAVIEAALAQGQALAVADVHDDRRFAGRESVLMYGVDQVLCIPIGQEAPFLGVLYLNRAEAHGEPVEQLLDVCTAITQLLQTGLQRFRAPAASASGGLERLLGPEGATRYLQQKGPEAGRAIPFAERPLVALHLELEGLAALPDEQLAAVLGALQQLCTRKVLELEGALASFGPGKCLAVFGLPFARADDAVRAVRAALAVRTAWEALLAGELAGLPVPVRAGVALGPVRCGTAGGPPELHLLGEAVGLAGSLAADAGGGRLLVTAKVVGAVGARFDLQPLGERLLPGARRRTPVFEVVAEAGSTTSTR